MKFLNREKYDIKYIKDRNRLIKLKILILRLKKIGTPYIVLAINSEKQK